MNEYEQHLWNVEQTILWEEAKSFEIERREIKAARARITPGQPYHDWQASVWMVKGLQITKDAGLDDLAWAMSRETMSYNDLEYLLDELQAYVERVTKSDYKPEPPEGRL